MINEDETQDNQILEDFASYNEELTLRRDKYERIFKINRDITIESKKLIFALHARLRYPDYNQPSPKIEVLFDKIIDMFKKINIELENEDPYQFVGAYTMGLQEFIEAVTFYKFMTTSCLVNLDQLRQLISFKNSRDEIGHGTSSPGFVTVIQYLLGVQDLTGEMMKLCISSLSANKIELAKVAKDFVQQVYKAMLQISAHSKYFSEKMEILRQSLLKMEYAIFTIGIRGTEMPNHMIENMINESDLSNVI